MTINEKLMDIRTKLDAMAVGACGVEGVRKDCPPHTLGSAVDWFSWKRNLLATS